MIVPVLDRKAAKPSQDLCLDLSGAQEAEYHVIPHIVQGFVQGEDPQGRAGGAGHGLVLVIHVQKQSRYLGGIHGDTGGGDEAFYIFLREPEDDAK